MNQTAVDFNIIEVLSDTYNFSNIAGLERPKQFIYDKIIEPFRNPELARLYDLKVGGGLLLYGPPGTGKTSLAMATAGEINASYFEIPIDIVAGFPGSAERKIDEIFFKAKNNGRSVIFLDEADVLLKQEIGISSVMNRVKGKLLQVMSSIFRDNNPVILIAATNRPWEIDQSFLRPGRFDMTCEVSMPDKATIYQLLRIKNHKRHHVVSLSDADYQELAELMALRHLSGADITSILEKTALEAYKLCNQHDGQVRKIFKVDFLRQIETTGSSIDLKYLEILAEWKRDGIHTA